MKDMDIVITMAGLGSRFRKSGYDLPKYMICVKGKSLFEWSMLSLKGYADKVFQYIFVVRKDKDYDVESFLRSACIQLGITDFRIRIIQDLTDGQAATAMLARPYWTADHSLLIYNIDTYVEPLALRASELRGDGFIPCFQGKGDHWSFVRLDDYGKAVEVREKERISDYCSLGAYYFRTCRLFESLYQEYYDDERHLVNGEKYVAPLYNHLLAKGGEIFISDVDSEYVHVLGTPEEVEEFAKT